MIAPIRALIASVALVSVAACLDPLQELDGPFYLGSFEASGPIWLFRCPDGPAKGCANDTLPDGEVLAAGANQRFLTLQMAEGYYYIVRVKEERSGWGNNPEKIVGPLTAEQFSAASSELGLPPLDVHP